MGQDTQIVRAAIYPGIGIARVGNSPTDFFVGPEVPYPSRAPVGSYHDSRGALKRQAARFRVYGFNAAGEVVKELTLDDAAIRWVVHVANKKAAWYNFELALDIPQAKPCARRNPTFTGADRDRLVIDPGAREISGRNRGGRAYQFNSGQFLGKAVYLGELRTDEAGRLLFLGGRGVSGTPFRANPVHTYANNDGWYDDICDGAVTAEVILDGERLPVDHAWVVVGPPNYAPDLVTIQTMYDVVYDAYQQSWFGPRPPLSFTQHIYPILSQLCQAQWVNYGFHLQFGPQSARDFLRPDTLARLASNAPEDTEVRAEVFNQFRAPDYAAPNVPAWPQVYGDAAFLQPKEVNPRYLLAITPTQYGDLQKWAEGDFSADWDPNATPPAAIEDVPLADQPATLDRAALHFCMGGPFHPGCEMTWPMRQVTLYQARFRLRVRQADQPEPDLGDTLTPENVWTENGPLYLSAPGDITRWMAVPWQTDTASCRSGYEPKYDPFLPTFWPARVPNHVLTADDYSRLMDASLSLEERQSAFTRRLSWFRGLQGAYQAQIGQMVRDFGKMGVVERRDGPDAPDFPATVYVESPTGFPPARALRTAEAVGGAPAGASDEAAVLAEAVEDLSGADVEKVQHLRRLGQSDRE